MSRIETVELIDDIDASPAAHTVNFGLDGNAYVIDLSNANAGALRRTLSGYTSRARRITGKRVSSPGKPPGRTTAERTRSAEIREWAANTGRIVSERGRIPAQVISDYDSAHTPGAAKFVAPGAANVTVTRNGPAARRAAQSGQTVGRARGSQMAPEPGDSPRGRERKGRSTSPALVNRRAARGSRKPRA